MNTNSYSEQSATSRTTLIARLDDALELFDEPVWRELRDSLSTGPNSTQTETRSAEWYKADPSRLAAEKTALSKLMRPVPECPDLLHVRDNSKLLGAVGLVALEAGKRVRLELVFPEDYPASAPRIFFFGRAAKALAPLLTPDGAIPVPSGPERQWNPGRNGAFIVSCAVDWLRRVVKVENSPRARRSPSR